MPDLVCPECGNDSFTAVLQAAIRYTYNVDERAGLLEVDDEIYDGGDLSDIETVECTDCGADLYPEQANGSMDGMLDNFLVTQEEYNENG